LLNDIYCLKSFRTDKAIEAVSASWIVARFYMHELRLSNFLRYFAKGTAQSGNIRFCFYTLGRLEL